MIETKINERWSLILPEHRAARPEWPVWEKERLAAMYKVIKPGSIVFDIGAEEGDFPALFSKWGAEIVLFEPNPLVWPNIRVIWEANNLKAVLGHFVGFAADKTNEIPAEIESIINQPDRNGWPECAYGEVIGNHGFRNISERTHDTPSMKIDDYVTNTGIMPDILTIDTEGSELLVLKGAEKILKENDLIVFVSIHPEFGFDHYGIYEFDVHDFLKRCGYKGKHIIFDHEHHYIFTKK